MSLFKDVITLENQVSAAPAPPICFRWKFLPAKCTTLYISVGRGKDLAYDWDVASIAGWTLVGTFLSTAAQTSDVYCPISFLMLDGRLFESTCRHLLQIDECKEAFSTVSVCALRLILHGYLWATNVENEVSSSTSQRFERLFANMSSHVYTKHLVPWKNAIAEWELALYDLHSNVSTIENRDDISIMVKLVEDSRALLHRCSRNRPHFTPGKLSLVEVIARHEFINTRPKFAVFKERSSDSILQTKVCCSYLLSPFFQQALEKHIFKSIKGT